MDFFVKDWGQIFSCPLDFQKQRSQAYFRTSVPTRDSSSLVWLCCVSRWLTTLAETGQTHLWCCVQSADSLWKRKRLCLLSLIKHKEYQCVKICLSLRIKVIYLMNHISSPGLRSAPLSVWMSKATWADVSGRKVCFSCASWTSFYWRCEAVQRERLMNERLVRSVPSCPRGGSSRPWGREGRTPLPPQFHPIQHTKQMLAFKMEKHTSSCALNYFISHLNTRQNGTERNVAR